MGFAFGMMAPTCDMCNKPMKLLASLSETASLYYCHACGATKDVDSVVDYWFPKSLFEELRRLIGF